MSGRTAAIEFIKPERNVKRVFSTSRESTSSIVSPSPTNVPSFKSFFANNTTPVASDTKFSVR